MHKQALAEWQVGCGNTRCSMNETVGRRVFVGSLAGAGVGALGISSLDISLAAQPTATNPLVREMRRQLREGIGKIQKGRAAGAGQLAAVLRVYASTLDDDSFRATLRKANRGQLIAREMNHAEMVRQAEELGLDPARLPPHKFIPYADREQAFTELSRNGLGPQLRAAADRVDDLAKKLEDLARRPSGVQRLNIALRQPIPEPRECGDCSAIAIGLDYAEKQMGVACGLAGLFPNPVTIAACEAAIAAFMVMLTAFGTCRAVVALCEAFYD